MQLILIITTKFLCVSRSEKQPTNRWGHSSPPSTSPTAMVPQMKLRPSSKTTAPCVCSATQCSRTTPYWTARLTKAPRTQTLTIDIPYPITRHQRTARLFLIQAHLFILQTGATELWPGSRSWYRIRGFQTLSSGAPQSPVWLGPRIRGRTVARGQRSHRKRGQEVISSIFVVCVSLLRREGCEQLGREPIARG